MYFGEIQEQDGYLVQEIYGRECKSPLIPEDRTSIINYGDAKGKFVRALDVIPQYMHRLPESLSDCSQKQTSYIKNELRKIYFTGEFQYIKGQLTWFTPWMYLLMNWWPVPVETADGKIEYRDEQRRKFCFLWDVYKHPFDLGVIDMKKRRTFGSTMAQMLCYWHATHPDNKNKQIGQTSYTKEKAQNNFKNLLLPPISKLPTWLQPEHMNPTQKGITFDVAAHKMKSGIEYETLGSSIIFDAPQKQLFDSTKLIFGFLDEVGKWMETNINDAWTVARQCITLGILRKVGWMYMPTTVNEGENGGEGFLELWDNAAESTKRGSDGTIYRTTTNGLVQYFSPSIYGLENYIGPYGEDVVEDPDDEQWEYMQKQLDSQNMPREMQVRMGSKRLVEESIKQFTDSGDERGLLSFKRQYPMSPEDVFASSADKCPFNTTILNNLLSIVRNKEFIRKHIRTGTLHWDDPVARTRVEWIDDANGQMMLTWMPENINNVIQRNGGFYPGNENVGVLGLDPYNKSKVLHEAKASAASLHGKRFFDYSYEMRNKAGQFPEGTYVPSYSFFFRYNNRKFIDEDIYEDFIMIMHFLGMPIAIESQFSRGFETYANARGYSQFLLRKFEIDGERYPTPQETEYVGIPMTDQYALKGVDYHDMFLRGRGAHLGEFTYDICETPLRLPFWQTVDDHLKFTMKNRKPHDDSMSCIITSVAEAGICDFSVPMYNLDSLTEGAELPSSFFS